MPVGIENPVHILFVAAVALIVLGPKRLPDLARAAGRSMREFREALNGGVVEGEEAVHAEGAGGGLIRRSGMPNRTSRSRR